MNLGRDQVTIGFSPQGTVCVPLSHKYGVGSISTSLSYSIPKEGLSGLGRKMILFRLLELQSQQTNCTFSIEWWPPRESGMMWSMEGLWEMSVEQ